MRKKSKENFENIRKKMSTEQQKLQNAAENAYDRKS